MGVVECPKITFCNRVEARVLVDLTYPSNSRQDECGDDRDGDKSPETHRMIFVNLSPDVPSFWAFGTA